MSSTLKLPDGTEFDIRYCISNRPVIIGSDESGLEKLMGCLKSDARVIEVDGRTMTYQEFQQKAGGPFVAYIPYPGDYLKICNVL